MAHRVEQTPVRSAMGVVATDAGIRAGPDTVVTLQEVATRHLVAATTQGADTGPEQTFHPGTMGGMALAAVPDRRPVRHALAPEPGHIPVAGKAEHGLSLFQQGIVGRAVGGMAGEAFTVTDRLVGGRGCGYLPVHLAVTREAEPSGLLPDQGGIIGGMGGMAAPALSPGHRLMHFAFPVRIADIPMAGAAENTALLRLTEKGPGHGIMQLVTSHAVPLGKGAMQAEPAPFVGLPAMAAETELFLGCAE